MQCQTTFDDGVRCRGEAYDGGKTQCLWCQVHGVPPCTELTLTLIASSFEEARAGLQAKREAWERDYPHARLLLAGDDHEYFGTKSRRVLGERHHFVRYLVVKQ